MGHCIKKTPENNFENSSYQLYSSTYIFYISRMELGIEKRLEGTQDILPDDHTYMTFLKKVFRHEFRKNGFRRISTPLIEETALLRKAYPEKQNRYGLYHFENTNDIDISLVPSGTVWVMRSYIENELHEWLQPVYYYYMERCFRQKRKRKEYYTMWWEVIGESDPIIDAQNLFISYTALQKIGLADELTIRINSYGNTKEMEKYSQELQSFFENKKSVMSEQTADGYEYNVFAPFYGEDEDDRILAQSAPPITKFLKKDSQKNYQNFTMYLEDLGIDFIEDHTLFFPETYYTGVVWQIEDREKKVVASWGRYDTLATILWSPKSYGASGFSLDVDYIISDLQARDITIKNKDHIDLYFVQLWDEAKRVVFPLSLEARARGINTQSSLGTPSMKEQMLKAQRIGASYVVLVGLMEARNGVFQVRNIDAGTQEEVKKEDLIEYIIEKIGKEKLDFYEPSRDLVQSEK